MNRTRFTLHPVATTCAAALLACAGEAFAARPLSVDDTGTNAPGAGHVEAWVARTGGIDTFNVSPAIGIVDGLELVAALTREASSGGRATTLQLRWTITPVRDEGCSLGASGGRTQVAQDGGHQHFVVGMLSCSFGATGTMHSNLGLRKASGAGSAGTWGIAFERAFGAVTPHLELFGEKGARPTLQAGARAELAQGVQLDGTIGRQDGATIHSLGLKLQF